MKNKYTIKAVSMSCGIKPQTLRVWESRYGAFNPERSDNGRRLYSDEDVLKANLLAKLTYSGQSISNIATLKPSELESLLEQTKSLDTHHNLGDQLNKLYESINNFEIEIFTQELSRLQSSMGVREFLLDVILPIMRDIGEFVVKEKYTVTQEHVISTLVRSQLSQIKLSDAILKNDEIIFATPEGNRHDLSIYIADILAKYYGFRTFNLGAAHPSDSLAHALNILKKPLLVLGVLSTDSWQYEKDMDKYLSALDNLLSTKIDIILGGGYEIPLSSYQYINKVYFMSDFNKYDKLLLRL